MLSTVAMLPQSAMATEPHFQQSLTAFHKSMENTEAPEMISDDPTQLATFPLA